MRRPSLDVDETPLSLASDARASGGRVRGLRSRGALYAEYHARVAEAPGDGRVRGMFFSDLQRLAPPDHTQTQRRYLPFTMYPLREFMQLALLTAQRRSPSRAPADALRELGRRAYGVFASSMAGMSLLSTASAGCEALLARVPQAYAMVSTPGSVRVLSARSGEAVIALRDVWSFPESYNVGAWLGGMEALAVDGQVDVVQHSWCNVDLHVRFSPRKEGGGRT
ncbi:MAG: DUF2378 family protein [Polyangiales bacterium]